MFMCFVCPCLSRARVCDNRGQKIRLRIPGLCMHVIYMFLFLCNLLYVFPRNLPTEQPRVCGLTFSVLAI